jgi:hypothetical protein
MKSTEFVIKNQDVTKVQQQEIADYVYPLDILRISSQGTGN